MNKQQHQLRWHYLIYRITNIDNGMIYIGQHRTANPNDSYMGSGTLINQEYDRCLKAGCRIEDHFKREILFDFDNFKEMNDKEREIVNADFVADPNTYNRTIGGNYSGNYNNGCIVIEYEGQTHSLAEWEAILGIDREIIRYRYKKGMTMQQIIDIPPRERDKIWFKTNGEGHTIYEWSKISGLNYYVIRRRLIELKMSVDEAVRKPKAEPKRYPYKGRMMTMQQLMKISGLSMKVLLARIGNYGWPVEKVVDTPLMPNPVSIWEQKFEWKGKSYTIEELAALSGGKLFKRTIHDRIKDGWDIDKIMSTPSKAVDQSWRKKKYAYHDKMLTIEEGAKIANLTVDGLRNRIFKYHMTFEDAVDKQKARNRGKLFEVDGVSKTIHDWSIETGLNQNLLFQRLTKQKMTMKEAISLGQPKAHKQYCRRSK